MQIIRLICGNILTLFTSNDHSLRINVFQYPPKGFRTIKYCVVVSNFVEDGPLDIDIHLSSFRSCGISFLPKSLINFFHVRAVDSSIKHVMFVNIGALGFGQATTPSMLLSTASLVSPFLVIGGILSVEDDNLIHWRFGVPGSWILFVETHTILVQNPYSNLFNL